MAELARSWSTRRCNEGQHTAVYSEEIAERPKGPRAKRNEELGFGQLLIALRNGSDASM